MSVTGFNEAERLARGGRKKELKQTPFLLRVLPNDAKKRLPCITQRDNLTWPTWPMPLVVIKSEKELMLFFLLTALKLAPLFTTVLFPSEDKERGFTFLFHLLSRPRSQK